MQFAVVDLRLDAELRTVDIDRRIGNDPADGGDHLLVRRGDTDDIEDMGDLYAYEDLHGGG